MVITLDQELKRQDPMKEIRKIFGEDPNFELDLESGHFSTPVSSSSIGSPATRLRGNPATRLRGNPTNTNNNMWAMVKEWLMKKSLGSVPNWASLAVGIVAFSGIIYGVTKK